MKPKMMSGLKPGGKGLRTKNPFYYLSGSIVGTRKKRTGMTGIVKPPKPKKF